LSGEQLAVPYEAGINPPIWELGHAAFFYECFILRALDGDVPRMPGYDEVWDSFEIRHEDRWRSGVVPEREITLDYYKQVLDCMRNRISNQPLGDRECYLYHYAICHQNMHIESLIWGRQTLAYAPPPFADKNGFSTGSPAMSGDAEIPGGRYPIGIDPDSGVFGFDNEKPGFEITLAPFALSKTLVSNAEFLAFIDDGGYENESVWSYGGAQWLRRSAARRPLYWRQADDGPELRWFDQWLPLPLHAPVLHINFWEAEAFASWSGRRLPTEFEWEAAARGREGRFTPWGGACEAKRLNMNGKKLGRASVTDFSEGATPEGCLQMLGTGWEWTSSQFLPYAGFQVDMYPYMSTLQFGDHKVTRGGSCATSSSLIRNTYRQAYLPDRRDVFTALRTCAVNP
jgi:iron(II)-dependent oxidoreductase